MKIKKMKIKIFNQFSLKKEGIEIKILVAKGSSNPIKLKRGVIFGKR
jgi:hypothetical protein